jgi:hypothetical protein
VSDQAHIEINAEVLAPEATATEATAAGNAWAELGRHGSALALGAIPRAAADDRSRLPEPQAIVALQRAAGNTAVRALLQRQQAPPATPPASAPAPAARPASDDKELLDREDKAIAVLSGLNGSAIASFTYESPMSPRYQPPEQPPTASLTMGQVTLRATSDDQKRRSFDSQGEATAFATAVGGPTGAVVLTIDKLWFGAPLVTASASEFKRENVWRFSPNAPAVAAIGKDGFVFVGKDYTPSEERVGKVDRPEKELAAPASADDLRKIVGIAPEDQRGEGKPKPAAAVQVPPGQEERFICSYFIARALEALDQNEAQADKLAQQFKPQPKSDGGSGIDPSAQKLIDQTRELGPIFKQLEDTERRLGEYALWLVDKHYEGKWRITVRGQTKGFLEWRDEIDRALKKIAEAKTEALSRSPLLATMVRRDQTPTDASGWAAKLGYERFEEKWIQPALGPAGALANWAWDKFKNAGAPPKWEDSPLAKKPEEATPAENEEIAADFRTKLDAIHKAIAETRAKVTGDLDFVLGMSSLRARVSADFAHIDPKNKALKDALTKMLQEHDMREDAVKVAEIVVQIAALFLPGGQFISAAIGFGIQAKEMDKHMDEWNASQATVDPAKALVDQQDAERALLADTVMMAIQAVDLAASVKSGFEALEAGRVPKEEPPKPTEGEPGRKPPEPDGTVDRPLKDPDAGKPGLPAPGELKDAGDAATTTGGHVHVTRDGRLFSCTSACTEIRAKYANTLANNKELLGSVEALESRAKKLGPTASKGELDAVAREVATLDQAISKAAKAERAQRIMAWLPDATKRYKVLQDFPLGADQIARIAEKADPAHIKGQLLEELMARKVEQMLGTEAGRTALAGERAAEKLEFIPGHLVRDAKGRQFSDGLIVIRRGPTDLEVVTILESKAGKASSRGLKSAYTPLKELDDEDLFWLRMDAIDELRETNPRQIPGLDGMSSTEIDELYKADVDRIIDRLPKSEGGQPVKDIERLVEGGITIDGKPTKLRGGRGSTKVVGAVPSDVSAKGLKDAVAQQGVKFDVLDMEATSKEINSLASEIAAQANAPKP